MDWFSKPIIFFHILSLFFWHIFFVCLQPSIGFFISGYVGGLVLFDFAFVCPVGIRGRWDKGKAHALFIPVFNFQMFNSSSAPSIVPWGFRGSPGSAGQTGSCWGWSPTSPSGPSSRLSLLCPDFLHDQTSVHFPVSTNTDQSLDRGTAPICFVRVPANWNKIPLLSLQWILEGKELRLLH